MAERTVNSGDKVNDTAASYSPTRKISDSVMTHPAASVTASTDSALKATVKEKRKLSSGLSRATTKKRSSTPGVSPHISPTRDDETPHTERRSRPRSRGTPTHSSTDTEGSDADIKCKKTGYEIETDGKRVKTTIVATTPDNGTTTKGEDFDKTNVEYYGTGGKETSLLSHKLSEDSQPHEDDELSGNITEHDGPERMKTKSTPSSSPERATDKSPSTATPPHKVIPKEPVTAKSIKNKDSTTSTAKTTVKKLSKGEIFQSVERSPSPQKSKADDADIKTIPTSQESYDSSPSSSPIDRSAITCTESPKSILDKLPRETSPEYSSEGSLVNELYPRQSAADSSRELSSPVKQLRDVTKYSPDSSPERGNFRPIKCFRTSPEIRPQTLEFAHPQTEASFKAPPEEPESPTAAFNKKPGDAKDHIEKKIIPSTKPCVRKDTVRPTEQISTKDTDFKKSPERVRTLPVLDSDDLGPASCKKLPSSTKRKPDIDSNVPFAQVITPPTQITKQKVQENEGKSDHSIQYSPKKMTTNTDTRKHTQDITVDSSSPERNLSEHTAGKTVGKLSKPSEKPKEENTEIDYNKIKKLPETGGKPKTEEWDVEKNIVQQSKETKSSGISPRSSSTERPLTTATAKITLKQMSPQNQNYSREKDTKSTRDYQSHSTLNKNLGQQYPSYASPERGSPKRGITSKSNQPQKSDSTPFSKPTSISNRIPGALTTPDKPAAKKSDRPLPSLFHSSEKPKSAPKSPGKERINKAPASICSSQVPSRDLSTTETSKRPSHKSSPSPGSSPDRTTPNRATRKGYDSSPDSRRSPSLSPERVSEGVRHPGKGSRSPDTTPSSSPERHKSPEKIRAPGLKPLAKPSYRLPENYSPSSSPERRSRIPSSTVRDLPSRSPARPSQPKNRPNQSKPKSGQSPVHPAQKSSRPNLPSTRTPQSPARPSQNITRTDRSVASGIQSPAHSRPSHPGSRYETQRPKKSESDTLPVKSAFVRTPTKPEVDSHSPKTLAKSYHTSDHYPSKNYEGYVMRLTPSAKGSSTAKREPRQQKPEELDDERSTDRSSTLSSPETVKPAEDSPVADTTYFADTWLTDQQTSAKSHKRTEVYIPELSHDREPCSIRDDQGEKLVSLSELTITAAVKTNEIAASSVTALALSNKKTKTRHMLESEPQKGYSGDDYNVEDLRDETPPEEFLVEDKSPVGSPLPSYSAKEKSHTFPEDIRDVPQARTRDQSPKNKLGTCTPASRSVRAAPLPASVSKKPTAANVPHGKKQDNFVPVREKQTASISGPKRVSTSRPVTTTEIRTTRSDTDKVTRRQTGGAEPRHETLKPEKASVRTTAITRTTSSTRQQQAVTVAAAAAKVSAIRTTKIVASPVKSTLKKGIYAKDQNRTNDKQKCTVSTTVRNQTVTMNARNEKRITESAKKKFVNRISEKTHTSSSEDEQEIPETVTDYEEQPAYIDDEHDESYVRELEDLRRTDEKQYATKLTSVSISENKLLSPVHDVPGIIIQPLKSSRESSPEYLRGAVESENRPRYADRISEPEDDDDAMHGRHRPKATEFQKPVFHLEAFDEEYTSDDSKFKFKQPTENSQPNEFPGYVIPHSEQITDLDEESDTEEARRSVSVAERVSHFLETTRNAGHSTFPSTESTQQIHSSPDSIDSPNTVRRARAMFETIANSQTSKHKDTTKQKDTVSICDMYYGSSRKSPSLDNRKLDIDDLDDEESASPLIKEQFLGKEDNSTEMPGTRFSGKKPNVNEYNIDTEKVGQHYRDSHQVPVKDDAEKLRISLRDTYFHRKSPSPERQGYEESTHTQPCNKAPTSSDHRNKPSSGNVNYGTYKKTKPSDESTLRSKTVVTHPEISSNKYDIFTIQGHVTSDIQSGSSAQKKHDQPVKELSKQEPSSSPRNGSVPEKEKPQDSHSRRQAGVEYFPEDTLIHTFTKDTTTQREIMRQKDILNRPSVFEARRLEQKVSPSTNVEQLSHTYEVKTSGHPDTYLSDYDKPIRSDVKYSTDTFTNRKSFPVDSTSSVAKTSSNQEHSEEVYAHETITSSRKDLQPRKQFSTDTFPRRTSSRNDTSPTRRDCAPGRISPVRQDTGPQSRKYIPSRNDSYPREEGSPAKTSTGLRRLQPTYTESSPIKKHPSPKDTSPTRKEMYHKLDSPREGSPTRKYLPARETLPTTRDSSCREDFPRDKSPTRKPSSPEDTSLTRKESYTKRECHREGSPTRSYSFPKDTSPTRKESYPKGESPREGSPTRGFSSPKDTSPTRKESYPKGESPREGSPTRGFSSPKDILPARRKLFPKEESPREGLPTRSYSFPKDTSPTRKEPCPKGESPREGSPTRGFSSPRDTLPARRKLFPKEECPREGSPTRNYSSPKDTSPTRKEPYPKKVSPREGSPTRNHSSPKDALNATKESDLRRKSSGDSSPTRKESSRKDTSPTRKDSYPKAESPRDSYPTRKESYPKDDSPCTRDSYSRGKSHSIGSSADGHQTSEQSGIDDRYPSDGSPVIQEVSPRRTPVTGSETETATPRRGSQTYRHHPKEEPDRASGRFGVNLRRMGSAVSSTVKRRLSGETAKPATALDKKGEEPNIEDIFDLELLERMVSSFQCSVDFLNFQCFRMS
jgi:hypothetical protein